jgi:tetratricopeptide (TPR) repeat protein
MPFWPFRRAIKVEPLAPEELQARLVEAARSGRGTLRRFCRAYRDQIEANVETLRKAPPDFRANPAAVDRFVQSLAAAAQCLASEFQAPGLWNALTGTPADNPILRWQAYLDALPDRLRRLEHDALREELPPLIEETKRFEGTGSRKYEAFFNARLAEVCFHSGRASEAVVANRRALELCREQGEQQGVTAYLTNAVELGRYVGDAAAAIQAMDELHAELSRQGRAAEAAAAAKRLALLSRGEPPCRIVCRSGDQVVELDELKPKVNTHYAFEFVRNRQQVQLAVALTKQGSEKASAGQLADAIELFERASEVDPYDPDPCYQRGVALLDLGAYAAARESFEEVDRLAPGWFRCRTDAWLAGKLESGELPAEVHEILRALEDSGMPPKEVEAAARFAVERHPEFAPFWLILGDRLRDRRKEADAKHAYRQGLACAQEPDVESRLLTALAGILRADDHEQPVLIRRALGLRGSLVALAAARILNISP